MSRNSTTTTLVFSCLGHLYVHLFTAFFFVIVLSLEIVWSRPYHELVSLWTLGALMVGLAALPAGWLGDRWSASGMMVVFFLGMGACSVLAGLAGSAQQLMVALTGLGVFAAIYHPVGIPWLIRSAAGRNRGKLLGFNGIFGSLGAAAAGITAGSLIDLINWRAAFLVPGFVSVATGLALLIAVRRGVVRDARPQGDAAHATSGRDRARVFLILVMTMFLAAVVYHATQTSLPKVLELRLAPADGDGVLAVGLWVAAIYTGAGLMQFLGGHLADRLPLKLVYVGATALQIPVLWWAASLSGAALVPVATIMVMGAAAALPAENMLLARYAPVAHHGLAFGVKFVLAFGAGPVAIQFVAVVNRDTGEFFWVFATLALLAALGTLFALLLPAQRSLLPTPQPAVE